MVEFQRLLCPSDLSSLSRSALALCLALQERYGGMIRALHVHPPITGPPPSGVGPRADIEGKDPAQVFRELSGLLAPALARGASAEAVVVEGDAAEVIVRQALDWPADLVVMGTRGLCGERPWAVGSVTEAVLLRAPCPVLTVSGAAALHLGKGGIFRHILCPCDFSEPCRAALDHALSLARGSRPRLTLLNVIEGFPEEGSADDVHLTVPEYRLDFSDAASARLRAFLPEHAEGWCERKETVAVGKPYREILRVAREAAADLIVLGVHGRRAHDRSLYGGTLCHVVREAACPVLAVCPGRSEATEPTGTREYWE